MENFLREGVDLQAISVKAISAATTSGDAHFFEDSTPPSQVHQFLDSSLETDKLRGMKWLLAMLSKGKDVSEFFPAVVKNVVVKSLEVKKMKDMAGSNPLIRGLTLRVMTSIRVPELIPLQLMAARKCVSDSSPYVRKCSATALTKIHNLDQAQLPSLKQLLEKLLRDSSTMVLGSAVAALNEICPTCYELLHRPFRKICHLLADMDEWTQISTIEVLCRYVRTQFTDPAPGVTAAGRLQAKQRSTAAVKGASIGSTLKRTVVRKAFYSDDEDEEHEEEYEEESAFKESAGLGPSRPDVGSVFSGGLSGYVEGESGLDPDHRLALRSSQPLLKSRNAGVVLGVCALHYYCGSHNSSITQQIGKSLVRILRDRREVQAVVLTTIRAVARERPAMFRPFLPDFFVKAGDPGFCRLLKLDVLTAVCTKDSTTTVLRELQVYIRHSDPVFVCAAVRAVGRVADIDPSMAGRCLEGLTQLLRIGAGTGQTANTDVTDECAVALRHIIQQCHDSNGAAAEAEAAAVALRWLVRLLIECAGDQDGSDNKESRSSALASATARASVVWLVGEYSDSLLGGAPDVLRLLLRSFTDEAVETKLQIAATAVKLALRYPDNEPVQALSTFALELARYDPDTDIRDRSRVLTALMGLAPTVELAGSDGSTVELDEDALADLSEYSASLLLAPKLPPITLLTSIHSEDLPAFSFGSLSCIVGHCVPGYQPLPSWVLTQPDPTVRDPSRGRGGAGSGDDDQEEWASQAHTHASQTKRSVHSGSTGTETTGERGVASDGDKNLRVFYAEPQGDRRTASESDDSDESDSDSDEDSDEEEEEDDSADDDSDEDDENPNPVAKATSKRQPGSSVVAIQLSRSTMRRVNRSKSASNSVNPDIVEDLSDFFPSLKQNTHGVGAVNKSATTTVSKPSVSLLDSPFPVDLLTPHPMASPAHAATFAQSQQHQINISSPLQTNQQLLQLNTNQVPSWIQPPQQPFVVPSQQYSGLGSSQGQHLIVGNSSAAPMTVPIHANFERFSEPKSIVRPDLAGGLAILLRYRFNSSPAASFVGAQPVLLIVQNHSDHNIRRVKVSFPNDLRGSRPDDVPLLQPGQEIAMPLELVLGPFVDRPVRVDVRCDSGTYVGTFLPHSWELMEPLRINSAEFEVARKRLCGLNEMCKSGVVSDQIWASVGTGTSGATKDVLQEAVVSTLMRMLNAYVVQGSGQGPELRLAGLYRRGVPGAGAEDRVLIAIDVRFDGGDRPTLVARANCEDPLLCTALMEVLGRLMMPSGRLR